MKDTNGELQILNTKRDLMLKNESERCLSTKASLDSMTIKLQKLQDQNNELEVILRQRVSENNKIKEHKKAQTYPSCKKGLRENIYTPAIDD